MGQVGSHPSHRSHWRSAFPSPVGPSGRLVGWNAFFGGTSGDFGGASGAERTPQWDRWDASGAERTPRWDRWETQRTPKSPTRNAFCLFGGLSGIGGVSVGETVFSVGVGGTSGRSPDSLQPTIAAARCADRAVPRRGRPRGRHARRPCFPVRPPARPGRWRAGFPIALDRPVLRDRRASVSSRELTGGCTRDQSARDQPTRAHESIHSI